MTEKQKDAIVEIQELIGSIRSIINKYELEDEFISVIAVGFLDMQSKYKDEDGCERANMNLLSFFAVSDEEELDDLLSYCVEAYRIDVEDEEKPSEGTIDWWLNKFGGDNSIN